MIIAYLFNQYPRTAQAAMRREIIALDELGITVDRYTVRATDENLVDPADLREKERARAVLSVGKVGLLRALLGTLVTRPRSFFQALGQTIRMGRRSERGILVHLIYLAEACVLRGWLRGRQTTHLHCHYGTNSAAVALLCRLIGGPPYSFTMHGPEEFDSPRALSLRDKIHHAAFVVAICDFTRSQLSRWADYEDWPKIKVVRCGVDAMFLEVEPTPVPDVPRLVNIGRIAEQKGQMLLIEAAGRLNARGIACEVAIVGDGPMRPQAEQLVERLGLVGKVKILGYQSNLEVRRQLQESRALVLPSFAEGLPGVFFEAFALGRPVIATYIAGNPELVIDPTNGRMIPAGSVDALESAMAAVLATPTDALTRMGLAGRDRVVERHDARIEARKLVGLFAQSGGVGQVEVDSSNIPAPTGPTC